MTGQNFIIQNININNYNLFLHFYNNLYSKKYNLTYTSLMLKPLYPIKLYYTFLLAFYIKIVKKAYYSSNIYLNKVVRSHMLTRSKYTDLTFFRQVKQTYTFSGDNFLYTLNKKQSNLVTVGPVFETPNLVVYTQNYTKFINKLTKSSISLNFLPLIFINVTKYTHILHKLTYLRY